MELAKRLSLVILTLFTPIKGTLLTAATLVIIDFILGIAASYKVGTPITSNRMRDSVGKALAYELTILLAFLAQRYLTGEAVPLVNIAGTYIAITELTSCLENMNALTGQNVLSAIIAKINAFKD